ncbi:serine/threonine protein phosphatase [Paenibacillaceae bacterium]|nr:serine/threonine protein phosphatase [Paenibacillaceae bacterium]
MRRKIVISDIHGCYDEFVSLLDIINYEPEQDQLILLGDYCDRGFKSRQVIEKLIEMKNKYNMIILRGNHDQMFIDYLSNSNEQLFLINGGFFTIESYIGTNWFENGYDYNLSQETKKFITLHYRHHLEFLESTEYYYEDENFIYVHAGIDPNVSNWRDQSHDQFLWIRNSFLNQPTNLNKLVIFGHTPAFHLHNSPDIWFGKDKIGIDGGCVYGYQLNCLEISNEGFKEYHIKKGVSVIGKN